MNHIATKCSPPSRTLPVEWPLTHQATITSNSLSKDKGNLKRIKSKKSHRKGLATKKQRIRTAPVMGTTEQGTQTVQEKQRTTYVGSNRIELDTAEACETNDVMSEPEVPSEAGGNIFQCLDQDEATWLADEVHQANQNAFRAEKAAEKLRKNDVDLKQKKESFDALKNLLQDLHRNIKYPDEETAKDLDTLDDVSNNFGVRNMVNYLGLLDGYFNQLETQLEK